MYDTGNSSCTPMMRNLYCVILCCATFVFDFDKLQLYFCTHCIFVPMRYTIPPTLTQTNNHPHSHGMHFGDTLTV